MIKNLRNLILLILSELEDSKENDSFEILENSSKIAIPIQLTFEKVDIPFDTKNHSNKVFDELFSKDTNTISIDYDKVHFPLTIRKKQKGDVFYPIGLNGKKKVSKFFKDEKLSQIEKENISETIHFDDGDDDGDDDDGDDDDDEDNDEVVSADGRFYW